MITSAQAAEYLDKTLGMGVPSFVLSAAIEKVEALEPDLLTAYDEPTVTLIEAMAVALVAAAGAPRQLRDQRAPSGAGRGFENQKGALSALRRSLEGLDTSGITAAVVGPDPAAASLFLVAA